jgi:glycerol-3-phosphate acyltransferase PlsY
MAVGVRLACGFAAVAGHVWPVWAGFRGGKGVAAAAGAFLALAPAATGIAAAVFVTVLFASRYMSLASMAAAVTLPLAAAAQRQSPWIVGAAAVIAALILARHRSNLGRIRDRTENRVSFGRKGESG